MSDKNFEDYGKTKSDVREFNYVVLTPEMLQAAIKRINEFKKNKI